MKNVTFALRISAYSGLHVTLSQHLLRFLLLTALRCLALIKCKNIYTWSKRQSSPVITTRILLLLRVGIRCIAMILLCWLCLSRRTVGAFASPPPNRLLSGFCNYRKNQIDHICEGAEVRKCSRHCLMIL